ncbi:hypothetical protein [Nocardioides yefusunii]|uniref:Matrixin family metalloprotease n=1 Tax=Nocardioides yefusunii TaxID=2500546 RepID=A0ABW1QRK0_9ACTN|nr:hypothetical protein [Nocardioides yefusunii]
MFERMTENVRRQRLAQDLDAPPDDDRRTSPLLAGSLLACSVVLGTIALSPGASFEGLQRLVARTVPWVEEPTGSYAFMQTQDDGRPVTYPPCEPVRVALNPAGAPADHEELLSTGLRTVSEATGLRFERVGTTTANDITWRGYGAPPPVLVRWADAEEVPELAGDVAGIGGSTATSHHGLLRYVTGKVVLDRDAYDGPDPLEGNQRQAIVDHELAHLVGLAHVEDRGELMNAENTGRTSFGPGDLAGLAQLGRTDC